MKNTLDNNTISLLLVIDVQNNFINKHTKNIPNKIEKLIKENRFNYVVFTKFINNKSSNFYKILNYKGCIEENDKKIVIDTKDNKILEKRTYTALNKKLIDYIKKIK